MRWFYRLQQRLAVTRNEATAVATLATLFLLGLGARYLQSRPEPLPAGIYAEADQLFAGGVPDTTAAYAPLQPHETARNTATGTTRADRGVEAQATSLRLNLNTATAAELERLPRIGPKTAARILEHRARYGPFRQLRDLGRVRGIGEKTLARLEPFLYVE